ncbi:MAG: PEGA domain-containing protein [Myxococcaceae bacterium]|nr:PEGA domain-containing protein [Myxococcaceae bacterium]MCA3012642.1 PEGA domain-containing protein [Myxococcaceae bacterium]
MTTPFLLTLALAAEPPAVVVVSPDDPALAARALETEGLPVRLSSAAMPAMAAAEAPGVTDERVVAARKAWVQADFQRCLSALADDALVTDALGRRDATAAARALAWRVACKVGARQPEGARRDAEWLAALGLALPPDVGLMTPDVETLFPAAARAVDQEARVGVTVESSVAGAAVAVDGRPGACIAPCRMELRRGVHVIEVSADGYTPRLAVAAVAAPGVALTLPLTPADPSLASAQWAARRAAGEAVDSGRSARLLATALRASRLVVLAAGEGGLVRGALAVDGVVQARGEREAVPALVTDLLVRGRVVAPSTPWWKRWPFWVAVGAAVVATSVTTGVVLANRPVTTRVELSP